MASTDFYHIEIFPLDQIRPTEEYSRAHSENLRSEIEITGVWTHPLLVDRARHCPWMVTIAITPHAHSVWPPFR